MRAIFCALVFANICFSETLSWNRNEVNEKDRHSRTRFLVARRSYHADLTKPPTKLFNWDRVQSTTISTVPTTSPPNTNRTNASKTSNTFSRDSVNKRRKYLRRELIRLRNTLKGKPDNDKAAREETIKRINEINAEIRKYNQKNVKHRRRKHKGKKHRVNKKGAKNNILEVTTARNKNYIFKWSLKNNTSLNKIITKLNENPGRNFNNKKGNRFKIQSDGVAVLPDNKLDFHGTANYSDNKLTTTDYNNDINLLSEASTSSNNITNDVHNSPTEFYDVLKVTPSSAKRVTEKYQNGTDKNTSLNYPTKDVSSNKEIPPNTLNKINYADLMRIESTTMPPVKNISLAKIFEEFNSISNQISVLVPGARKYPTFNLTSNDIHKKIKSRCSVRKGGCEHKCHIKGVNKCSCLAGFKLALDRRRCIDLNECNANNGGCKQICTNTPGSYYCGCRKGLRLADDSKSCEDINECLLRNGHGPCQDTCENLHGTYKCSCVGLNGTRLGKDDHTCEDVNECLEGRAGCSHGCVNTLGRAYCTCPDGLELTSDWKTCKDVNECYDEEIKKECKYGCLNTIGSYRCIENYELQNDQTIAPISDYVVCPPLFPPKHGFLECSRERGLGVKLRSKSGRRRVTNRPGTFCQLICPAGYKYDGTFKVTCGFDGQWIGDTSGKCLHVPSPKIKCPDSQIVHMEKWEEKIPVRFEAPVTNIDWKYVTSNPPWAKELEGSLPHGYHWITFSVSDPKTKITVTCSFDIIVKKRKN